MAVIDKYKYQLHFYCPSCGHYWLEGHHLVTLEEPCPRPFCSDEPIENYTYECSAAPADAAKKPKKAIRRAA
jgi:hypothetical protein